MSFFGALKRRYGWARGGGSVDEHALNELDLYMENTSELYNQKLSILKNVARRHKNGTYDHSLAPKLWMYWVKSGAQRYQKEFGSGSPIFNTATKEALAKEFADRYKNGEE